jgi:hypothetical protein
MEVSGQFHYPAASSQGKFSGIHWTGDTVEPRASLDAVEKINLLCFCHELTPTILIFAIAYGLI